MRPRSRVFSTVVTMSFAFGIAVLIAKPHRRVDSGPHRVYQVAGAKLFVGERDRTFVPEIQGYQKWECVTPRPVRLPVVLTASCVYTPTEQMKMADVAPHGLRYMLCYVNDVGKAAMVAKNSNVVFPIGTVIVKEKLHSDDPASKRLLITAMLKHSDGYNPEHGDWEYIVTNGEDLKLQARGKLDNCIKCHEHAKKTDYVNTRYSPKPKMFEK